MSAEAASIVRMPASATDVEFVDVAFDGRRVRIEHRWLSRERVDAPLVVFLHEGLGSLTMWKDYPQRLCNAGGYRGLVFSRPGYGRSTPRRPDERWNVDFMHRQAQQLLPQLFDRLGVAGERDAPWLFGHSDGASIALIHAATFRTGIAGVIAVAPHIVVEDLSIHSIEDAREAYRSTDVRTKLARYHDDVDSAFFGWNDIWLDPRFRAWSIEALLPSIACPVLAIQGADDEYGTLAQVEGIRERASQTEVVVLEDCRHSPHRDRPQALTRATTDFIVRHTRRRHSNGGSA